MNVAITQSQIRAQENKISSLQSEISAAEWNLKRLNDAKSELEKIRRRYVGEFKSANSYPNKIIAMDSQGLKGMDRIKKDIATAYKGTRERIFTNSMENALQTIQRKIALEESKISDCQRRIAAARNTITSLRRSLA